MAATWEVSSGTVTYKDGETTISISGLSGLTDQSESGTAVEGITIDGTEVTVISTLLPDTTSRTPSVSVTGGTLKLSGATAWKEEYQLGTFSSGTVPINLHQTAGWKVDDENNATSYTWTEAEADELLATITLTNPSATSTAGLTPPNGTTITVSEDAFNKNGTTASTVSIVNTGGVIFTLEAGLGTVPENNATTDNPTWDGTNKQVTQHYSAWYSAGPYTITYTPEKTETLATLTGFTGDDPIIGKTDKTLTVTTANVDTSTGSLTISGSSGYKLVLTDDDDDPTDGKVGFEEVAAQWVDEGGTLTYKSGYTEAGWTQASNGSSITYKATTKNDGTHYETLTTLSGAGLAEGVNADALNEGGATVDTTNGTVALATSVLADNAAADDPITVSNSYTITIDADQQFDHDAEDQGLTVKASGDNAIITRAQNAGWTGNSTNEIKYKSEVSALTLATITGVKSAAEGVSVDAATKVVTLAAGALSSGDGTATYTVTIQDGTNGSDGDSTFNGFKLALAEGIQTTEVDDDTATEVKMTLDTSAGTATVNKNKKEYWTGANTTTITYQPKQEGTGPEVAKITGLDTGITDSNVELDAANSTITLHAAALKTSDATVTGKYTIELDNDVTTEGTNDTDDTHVTRVLENVTDPETGNITGKTAKVNKDIKAYWKVEEGKVAYHSSDADLEGKGTTVATLTGLPTTATEADVVLDPSAKTLTLGATALQTTEGTVAEIDGSGGYTLALAGDIQATKADDTTVTMTVENGNVSVKNDEKAYYTVDTTDQKSITYTAKSLGTGTEVAAITGLATTATNEGETPNVILGTNTITLNKDALKDSDATVTGSYTIALGNDVIKTKTNETDDTKVTLNLAEVTEGGNTTKTATVNRDEQKYWTVESGKVEFHAASPGTGTKVAEVTGLATTAVKDTNVILDGTTITLKKDALPSTTNGTKATLTVVSGTYTLAKGDDAPASSATYSDPTLDLTDISSGNATYKRTPSAGWDLSGNEITYTVPADETLAVITGLKTDATAAAISLNANTGVITLKKAALNETNNNEVKFTDNTAGYTFALPDTVARYANTASAFAVGTVDANGEATITATVSKGWTFGTDNKSLTYHDATENVVVAKITGLNTGAESEDVTINSGTGVVTLKKAALPTSGTVNLVSYDAVADDGVDTSKYLTNFTLAIDGATAEGKLGYENTGYWTKKGTTAKYYETAMEGWTVGDTKREITYDAAQSTAGTEPIVTIENLTRSLTIGKVEGTDGIKRDVIGTGTYSETLGESTFVAGVSINDKEITLNKNVLGIESPMTVALGTGYTLKLNDDDTSDGYVLNTQTAENVWTYGVTTTYKNVDLEYWTYDGTTDTITYHPQVDNVTLATITGLKGTVSAEDIADTTAYTGEIGDVTAKGTITLNKDALNKRDVVINSDYYGLALNSDSAATGKYVAPPVSSNEAWSISGTVATYKANVTEEGYTAASDGSSVTYTAATGTNKVTLATVSGLKSGLTDSDLIAGLTVDADKVITLNKDVVGTSNIEVTGTNYTLNLGADHNSGIYLADDPEATTGVDVWRVDGTTATYKKVKFANYGIAADGKSIVYKPEADVELTKTETDATTGETTTTKVADKTIFATVEGLKSGLTAGFDTSDNSTWVGVDNAGTVSKELELNSNAIVLTAGALGTTDVTLTNGAAATEAGTTYELSLGDSAAEEALAPHMSDVDNSEADPNLTWSLNGTTAELKGMLVAGYTLNTDKDEITYTPENSGHVFATLTGLKSGITAGDLAGITGITSASDTEIKLDSRVLGTDTVLLDDVGVLGTSMGYELVPDTTDENYKVNDTDTAYFWTVTNGTATYKSATEAYYTPGKQDEDNDTVNNKITFTARDTEHATKLATLTGLKSGLTVVNDNIAGIDTDDDGTTFKISRDVLGTTNVTIDSSSPTFTLADGTAPEQDGGYYWTVEGTTAFYQFKSTAGYTQDTTQDNSEIVYQAAKSGNNANTVAQITGLKNGINKSTVESNIDVSESGDEVTFTLNEAVLGTTNVTLTEDQTFKDGIFYTPGTSYVLGLDSSVAAPDNTKAGWDAYDATNKSYTLKNYTTAGYTVDTTPTTILYTAGTLGNDIATVTGLKAGLTPNASTAQIAGIDIDYTNNKLILSANVLQKDKDTNVAIEADPNATETYALDLATTVATPAYTKAWAIKSGTATLTQEMSEGYINDGGEIVYKPKETVTTTISGLSSNVKVSDDKQKIGIQSGTTFSGITTPSDSINSSTATTKVDTPIPTTGVITLHKDALAGNATVTVATRNTNNTADYTLADFTGGQDLVTPTTAHWVKAANSTTATYQTETAQGYSRTDDHKITYYSNASGTPTVIATLKGLDKTVTADNLTSAIGAPTLPTYTTDPITGEVTETTPGVFTITDKSIFGKNNVTLTATDYIINFHDGSAVNDNAFANSDIANENAYWTYDGKNGKASLIAGTTGGWTFKQTKGANTKDDPSDDAFDYKTIVYTAAKPVTIATVTGLAKNTTYKPISVTTEEGKSVLRYGNGAEDYSLIATFSSGDGTKTAATTTTTNKAEATILVDKGILTTETQTGSNPVVSSNATVSVSSKAGYEFKLKADGDVLTPENSDKYWTVDNKGNAYYKYDTTDGYTLNAAGTSLVYSAEKSGSKATVIAKISGLDKTARPATADGVKLTEIDGIRITAPVEDDPSTKEVNEAAAGVFTLWNKDILTNKVTLSVTKGQPDYNLGVDEQIATADGGTKWYFKNGTATYREYRTAGYELNAKNSKLVESKGDIAGTTYVTISGLAKSTTDGTTTTAITEDRIKNESLIIVNADKTITLSDKIQGKTTITLANAVERKDGRTNIYYDYTIDPNSNTTYARVVNDPEWTVANGTATLKQTTGAGFTLGNLSTANGKQTLTYSKESTATLATVKGLANNFAVLTDAQATKYNTANAAAIFAGTLNRVDKNTFYTVSTETINNKKVTAYTAASDLLSYNADKIITVSNNALASKNVTVSGKSGYTLALGGDVTKNKATNETGWVVNGTTANYKDYVQDYYSLNTAGTTITYTKPKDIKVYATVTGLAKDSTIASGNWSGTKEGGVLTLTAANLGTSTIKIASKVAGQDTFLLALASDADTQAKLSTATNAGTWTLKNGTYTLSNNITVGFTQDFGGKTLTYNNKANKAVTVATVTGLNSKAKTSDITVSGDTITLSADALTNKNVAVTTNWGDTNYKLDIDASLAPTFIPDDNSTATGEADSPKDPSATKVPGWTISGSKGTLKGYVSAAGYTLSASNKSITYTGATATTKKKVSGEETYFYKDTATLATINGLKTTADKSGLLDNGTINLTSANTNGNLTLNTGVFAVDVDSSYAGKTITGSAGADNLTVQAAGKTITGGKGDDNISLGSNTFVYNNGDGHDVIADFTGTDQKLQVNSGAISVGMVGTDVVVKVGAGSINLGDSYTGDTIDIYAKDGKTKTTYAIQGSYTGATGSPNPLLVDDNYSMNAASLSDLVQPDSATFTPYDFDGGFSLTKEDKLTPQISYNNSDKK